MSCFPDLDADWFRSFGLGSIDPIAAEKEWIRWNEEHPNKGTFARKRYAIQLATGWAEATVRVNLQGDVKSIPARKKWVFDRLCKELGIKPPAKPDVDDSCDASIRQVAFLTEIDVPSNSYHWEVIGSFVREAQRYNIAVSVHPVDLAILDDAASLIARTLNTDAAVLLRLTPSVSALEILRHNLVPIVLIHADRLEFGEPVLANIVPDHSSVRGGVARWADKYRGDGAIVVVTMPRESTAGSLRDERIDQLVAGLSGHEVRHIEVSDYSFRRAFKVYEEFPDAKAYVALSDSIAVGLKHILTATGKYEQGMVVGYDGSDLASEEEMPSFGQSLSELGRWAIRTLRDFDARSERGFPKFQEISIDVRFSEHNRNA